MTPLCDLIPLFLAAKEILKTGFPADVRARWESIPGVAELHPATRENLWQLATMPVA